MEIKNSDIIKMAAAVYDVTEQYAALARGWNIGDEDDVQDYKDELINTLYATIKGE